MLDHGLADGKCKEAFESWQSNSRINPKFYQRQADHVRSGEPVRVKVILTAIPPVRSEAVRADNELEAKEATLMSALKAEHTEED